VIGGDALVVARSGGALGPEQHACGWGWLTARAALTLARVLAHTLALALILAHPHPSPQ